VPEAKKQTWPSRQRRKRGRCGCGAERTVEVQIKAQTRNPTEQLGSVSRTLCERCAKAVFDLTADLIRERAATPTQQEERNDG
jgi:hypothetical protein